MPLMLSKYDLSTRIDPMQVTWLTADVIDARLTTSVLEIHYRANADGPATLTGLSITN